MDNEQLDSDYITTRKTKSRVPEVIMKICLLGYVAAALMVFEMYKYLFMEVKIISCFANPYEPPLLLFILLGFAWFYPLSKSYSNDNSTKGKLFLATPFIQLLIYLFISFVLPY